MSPPDPSDSKDPNELQASWNDLKEGLTLPPMSNDELRKFVDDFVSGRLFSSAHLKANEMKDVGLIFLPVAMGALSKYNPDSLDSIGLIFEYLDQALPRGINGRPMFTSCRFMGKPDWERARQAIIREEERRGSIEV